jgi:cytoskeletal protein RodZ
MKDRKGDHPSETPNVSHIHTPGVAHEESDVKVSSVAWFTAGLAVLIVVTGVLMWGMFRFFARTEARKEPPPSSLTEEKKPQSSNPEEIFPEPRLQRRPLQDLQQYREEEGKRLTSYGWVDQGSGVVRIPIEDAKKRLVEQGLPFRQAAAGNEPGPSQGAKADQGSKRPASGPADIHNKSH